MSWASQQIMFAGFHTKDAGVPAQGKSENVTYEPSRNNLNPIRTFGRDISNLQNSTAFMQDRILTNSKATKKIKLKYPKNSMSRRKFGYDVSRYSNNSSVRVGVSSKRYISSSALTDRTKNSFKGAPQVSSKHQLYKRKIPVLKGSNQRIASQFCPNRDRQTSIQKCSIRSSVGGVQSTNKSINKSMKPRSMSRSHLNGNNMSKENSSHITTTTHLPNLHNMSTASLLSNCNYDKKQNSVLSNRSGHNSHSKLSFKVSAKTPTTHFMDKQSSTKKRIQDYSMSDEEKLRRFHSL